MSNMQLFNVITYINCSLCCRICFDYIDKIFASNPKTQIGASGLDVGLPDGQMGNSEVGHTNIGAGRIVYQELTRITKNINEGTVLENEALVAAMKNAALPRSSA